MTRKINEYSEDIPVPREQRAAKTPEQEAQEKRSEMICLRVCLTHSMHWYTMQLQAAALQRPGSKNQLVPL